jgi:hypothetical protein
VVGIRSINGDFYNVMGLTGEPGNTGFTYDKFLNENQVFITFLFLGNFSAAKKAVHHE